MKPTIQVEKNLTKAKFLAKAQKALRKAELYKQLTLFNDWTALAGPWKKGGRADVMEVAELFLTVEIAQHKKKKKVRK